MRSGLPPRAWPALRGSGVMSAFVMRYPFLLARITRSASTNMPLEVTGICHTTSRRMHLLHPES